MKKDITIYTCDKCGKDIGNIYHWLDWKLILTTRDKNNTSIIKDREIHLCETCKKNISSFINQEFDTVFEGV